MNESAQRQPGRFMVAVAAVLEDATTGNILMLKRSGKTDFAEGVWEDLSGRMHQGEHPEAALRREIREETSIDDVEIIKAIRAYHFFRGAQLPEFEVIGIAFWCRTTVTAVVLSDEHTGYRWVDPANGLRLAGSPGIRSSIEAFIRERAAAGLASHG